MCECQKTFFIERDDGVMMFEDKNKGLVRIELHRFRNSSPYRNYSLKWRLISERTGMEDE